MINELLSIAELGQLPLNVVLGAGLYFVWKKYTKLADDYIVIVKENTAVITELTVLLRDRK